MVRRLVVFVGLAHIVLAACAPHPPAIPEGDLAVFAFELDGFGSMRPVPPYAASFAPGSTPNGKLPQSLALSPAWSPDGEWIATTTNAGDRLALISAKFGLAAQIPTGLRRVDDIQWYPKSRAVVFTASSADADTNIYAMDLSCLSTPSDCQPSAKELVSGRSPSVSADEQWLAYTAPTWECRSPDPPCEAIFISPIDLGAPPKNITAPLAPVLASDEWPMWGCSDQYAHPHFSPTEPLLVFACGFDVYTYNLTTRALTNLTSITTPFHTEHNFPLWWPRDYVPAWSPQGDKILFLSDRDDDLGQKGSDFIANALFSMNPDGSELTRITQSSNQMITRYTWIIR